MSSSSRARRLAATARTAAEQVASTSRLVLAVKTALAASVAWYLAPFVPFADADYSYYAPLGVVVSMHPTVVESLRGGLLALAGLGSGIALGLGRLVLIGVGTPGVVVALVVGVGAALSGIRTLGAGRDWIALSGLFVLLIGGSDAGEFSISYLVTMAFGVVIGVAANYVAPPVYLREAEHRLTDLRTRLTDALRGMADMVGARRVDRDQLRRMTQQLAALSTDVAAQVREADRSRQANPRARRQGDVQRRNDDRWLMLECSRSTGRSLRRRVHWELSPRWHSHPRTPDRSAGQGRKSSAVISSTVHGTPSPSTIAPIASARDCAEIPERSELLSMTTMVVPVSGLCSIDVMKPGSRPSGRGMARTA